MKSARSLSERLACTFGGRQGLGSPARSPVRGFLRRRRAPTSARSRIARNSSRSLVVDCRRPVSRSVYEPDAIGQRRAETVNAKEPAVSAATTICRRP